ncbi:NAD-dependent epimerase/dehydratase family protein [Lentilactobacillus kisonensis]|uniref:NAD-dependent epimerase/dehydratase family protein n=1 Tax=Lentilactobacillus kisonensis TaxID=481722 RepID=UPI000705435C|nr:NAD-dependent epimerase/dehydratase family protein [Lentilactobacillus kisonensis]
MKCLADNVLVTGGAGFIGSNLVRDLIKKDNSVTVVDDLSMGRLSNLPESDQLTFYQKSITDRKFMDELLINRQFDYIYLLAAVASVADTIKRPEVTHQINQDANLWIMETLRRNQLRPKKVVFTSSAAVYGDDPLQPKSEQSRIVPLSPYAIDKFASERFVIDYGQLYGLNTAATRFFNVYGPRQNPSSPYSGVLSLITQRLQDNQIFTLFGDGTQSRDFVYVDDVILALQLIADMPESNGQVYNVATGHSASLIETIRIFEKISGDTLKIEFADCRLGDIQRSEADICKLRKLGYEPKFDLETGLRRYWEFNQNY